MEECNKPDGEVIFEEGGIKITAGMVNINGMFIPPRDIRFADVAKQHSQARGGMIFTAIISAIIFSIGQWGFFLFVTIVMIVGAFLYKPTYALRIGGALGEVKPLRSKDRNKLEQIKAHINAAKEMSLSNQQ